MAAPRHKAALAMAAALLAAAIVLLAGFQGMTDRAVSPSPSPGSDEEAADQDGFPDVDWGYWKDVNPDIVGWVTVPGTGIDYPILQASESDPDFYLHHDAYRKWSVYGVPYLDASCAGGGLLGSRNAVVFGHHMNDGSMFAPFARFSTDEGFARDHARILVQTPSEKRVVECRFAQIVDGSSRAKRTEFADESDYRAWYERQLSGASTVLDAKARPDALITWCTCSYNYFSNERTLVCAS